MRGRPWRRLGLGLLLLCLAGCVRSGALLPVLPGPMPLTAEQAEAARARLDGEAPASFKWVHQVAAQFQGRTFLMTGYLLGRREGAFRVTGLAPMGPRLFDVARIDGGWQTQAHLPAEAARLDPVHIGRAVQRIYFLDDGLGAPLRAQRGYWVASGPVPPERGDEEVDRVEVWRDPRTLLILQKRFFRGGKPVLDITFEDFQRAGEQRYARHVKLQDARGFTLILNVVEFEPGFPVSDAQLRIQ